MNFQFNVSGDDIYIVLFFTKKALFSGEILSFSLLFLLTGSHLNARTPGARCGSIYKSGTHVQIQSGWKFYITNGKNNWVNFTRPGFDDSKWKTLKKLPFKFSDLKIKNTAAGSTVWMRCYLELAGRPPDGMGIYMGKVAFSDEFYFNGVRVGKTGSPDQDLSDIEKERIYPLPGSLWRDGSNTLVIRIRGIAKNAFIQKTPEIVDHIRVAQSIFITDVPQIVFSYIYILVASFFAIFFIFFIKERQNLFFSLFCLFLGLYHLTRSHLRYEMFDSFESSYQFELLFLFVLPLLFSEFYHTLIQIKRNSFFKVIYGLYALLILACIIKGMDPRYWQILININLLMIVSFIIILGFSFFKVYKKHYSKLKYLLYGFSMVIPTMAMDIFAALGWHDLPRFTVYGFFFFLSAVSYQLSNSIFDLYHEINEQEKGLRHLEKKRTRSLFNLSNEFNTILEGLKRALEPNQSGLSKNRKKSKKRKSVSTSINKKEAIYVDRSVANLENLLRDSSMLVSLENGEYNRRHINFNLKKLINDTVAHALLATDQPKKRIKIDLQTDINELHGDPDLMSTALYHLIENALLYSLKEVYIQVETDNNNETIIRVRDEGPGIPADMQTSVLQKFMRDTHQNNIPGSGIGLTIVDLIMQTTGGSLSLDNGKGYYCEFTCVFPMEMSPA